MTNARDDRNVRWLIGWGIYVLLGCIAALIVWWYDLSYATTPILFVFLLGYLAGRISKGVER